MSITNTIKHPTKVVDGVTTFVSIEKWAKDTLSAAELTAFNEAKARNDRAIVEARLTGKITNVEYYDEYESVLLLDWHLPLQWPQTWGVCVNNGSTLFGNVVKYGLFNEDFTSNLPPLARGNLHGTENVANFTTNLFYTSHFDNSTYLTADNHQVLFPPADATISREEYTWASTPLSPDPVYDSFYQRFRTDPSLNWN
jgi:hypothetical protein